MEKINFWLDKSGNEFQCKHHQDWAEHHVLGAMDPNHPEEIYNEMHARGWLRVVWDPDSHTLYSDLEKPRRQQLRWLEKMALEHELVVMSDTGLMMMDYRRPSS